MVDEKWLSSNLSACGYWGLRTIVKDGGVQYSSCSAPFSSAGAPFSSAAGASKPSCEQKICRCAKMCDKASKVVNAPRSRRGCRESWRPRWCRCRRSPPGAAGTSARRRAASRSRTRAPSPGSRAPPPAPPPSPASADISRRQARSRTLSQRTSSFSLLSSRRSASNSALPTFDAEPFCEPGPLGAKFQFSFLPTKIMIIKKPVIVRGAAGALAAPVVRAIPLPAGLAAAGARDATGGRGATGARVAVGMRLAPAPGLAAPWLGISYK